MDTWRELASQLGVLSAANGKRQFRASLFVKVVLVIGGAAVIAIAHSVELANSNETFSGWKITELAAAALVAIGGVFVVITESDVSRSLEQARAAVEKVRLFQQQIHDFEADRAWLNKEITRGLELYNSMDVMRGAIEQSLGLPGVSAAGTIQTCLSAAYNSLLVALDFKIEDTWTICIYAAHRSDESAKSVLRCVAQARKILCEIAEAREWPEGVGVAGVAFSMGNDIIIPDMTAPELRTVFDLKTNSRSYDDERYRSMIAIPILVGADKIPWGVAVATSDQPHHFDIEPAGGVSTSEPVRAIAAMAALAVKAVGGAEPAPVPATQSTEATGRGSGTA